MSKTDEQIDEIKQSGQTIIIKGGSVELDFSKVKFKDRNVSGNRKKFKHDQGVLTTLQITRDGVKLEPVSLQSKDIIEVKYDK